MGTCGYAWLQACLSCADAMIKRAQNLLAQYKEMDIAQDRVLLRIPGAWLFAFCRRAVVDQAGLFK